MRLADSLFHFRQSRYYVRRIKFQQPGKRDKFYYVHTPLPTFEAGNKRLVFPQLRSQVALRQTSRFAFLYQQRN